MDIKSSARDFKGLYGNLQKRDKILFLLCLTLFGLAVFGLGLWVGKSKEVSPIIIDRNIKTEFLK